jgi:hypothetical protein
MQKIKKASRFKDAFFVDNSYRIRSSVNHGMPCLHSTILLRCDT